MNTCMQYAGFTPVQPTSMKELEAILQRLESKKEEWANLSTLKRADILRQTLKSVIEVRIKTPPCAITCATK